MSIKTLLVVTHSLTYYQTVRHIIIDNRMVQFAVGGIQTAECTIGDIQTVECTIRDIQIAECTIGGG